MNGFQVITAMLMQVQLGLDVGPCRLTKSYRLFRHESSGMETTELNDFVLLEIEQERACVIGTPLFGSQYLKGSYACNRTNFP
jgi:hypothetical protein